ncbi:MAG TPA: 3-oxoacyl-ACP reductase FabG [Parasulfuritortus sp.]
MEGKIALVTGASRGIGQAILHELAKRGAYVVGTATSESGAKAIGEALTRSGLKGEGRVLDVNDAAACEALVDDIVKTQGKLDVLVNNAGITRDTLLMRMKDEDWDVVIQTNLTSVFRMSKAAIKPMMKARAGRIVSIASVVGSMGNPGQTNYAAAKAGMMGFTKSLAKEVGSRGVTVNCVAPGFIDTDMTRALPEAQRQALLQYIPLARLGSVDDIAQAVAFLSSEQAGYITGTTLHVNGGMYMD